MLYFKNYYNILLCPKAGQIGQLSTLAKQSPADTLGKLEPCGLNMRLAPTALNASDWGGPTTAFDFPIPSTSDPALPLIGSYAANCWVYNPDTNHVQGRLAAYHWRKYGAPPHPVDTPLFLDSMWRGGGPDAGDRPPFFNGQEMDQHDEKNAALNEMASFAIIRHQKGVNALFFDGSVRNTRARDLWNLPWHRDYDFAAVSAILFPDWMN